MHQLETDILKNSAVSANHGRLAVACGAEYSDARPGQFIMLGFPGCRDPLLRRPFSIHRVLACGGRLNGIELLYKVVGPATRRISRLKAGDRVSLLGPLGNSFKVPVGARRIYLAAGGIGVAPLVFLAERLHRDRSEAGGWRLFLGGRSREDLLCAEDFERLGIPVHLTTDDGSLGDQCLVTHPLEVALTQAPPDLILACGPRAMLACIAGIVSKHRIPCQLSIETMMACGMGACLGCAVEGRREKDRYLHACRDGPVFDAAEIEI
jgi:dihydroorotate dehydrogenase electron transfer subunit